MSQLIETNGANSEHSHQIALELAEDEARRSRELLLRHPDLIGSTVVELIVAREHARAKRLALDTRESERLNDDRSLAPGLTVTFTKTGAERLHRAAKEHEATIPKLTTYAGTMILEQSEGVTTYSLTLPNGVYISGFGGIQLYGEAQREGDKYRADETSVPMSMAYEEVVNIVGASGERWQNPRLFANGLPRS